MLRTVFNTGILPPARACKDRRPLHAVYYLCPYGFLGCKQYCRMLSYFGFRNGAVFGYIIT